MGNLVNRASFGEHKEPTKREVLLSEIRQARYWGELEARQRFEEALRQIGKGIEEEK